MLRFLLLAITLVVLTMAVFAFAGDQLAPPPETVQADFTLGFGHMPPRFVLATWLLEAIALTALFTLIEGRAGGWLLDGLATGWVAWVFRGPLLVLTVAAATHQPHGPWWTMAQRWLILYTLCGILLAIVGRLTRKSRQPDGAAGVRPPELLPEQAAASPAEAPDGSAEPEAVEAPSTPQAISGGAAEEAGATPLRGPEDEVAERAAEGTSSFGPGP